jgi:hypothetical protein
MSLTRVPHVPYLHVGLLRRGHVSNQRSFAPSLPGFGKKDLNPSCA